MRRVIGVDFDNTLVSYDDMLHRLATAQGIIEAEVGRGKREIRDSVRRLADGERVWQRLQSVVYGPGLAEARLIEGVDVFFASCRQQGIAVAIISHKTEFAAQDQTRTNLRDAALAWMERHRFFDPRGFGLSRADVVFASTRQEKVAQIRQRGCTQFIDDLEETFLEPMFPSNVGKILYDPGRTSAALSGATVLGSWQEIHAYLFDADARA